MTNSLTTGSQETGKEDGRLRDGMARSTFVDVRLARSTFVDVRLVLQEATTLRPMPNLSRDGYAKRVLLTVQTIKSPGHENESDG